MYILKECQTTLLAIGDNAILEGRHQDLPCGG